MAIAEKSIEKGDIYQFKGPFPASSSEPAIQINGNCYIGVSISEDDYMKFGSVYRDGQYIKEKNFSMEITCQNNTRKKYKIELGRTFMYETQGSLNGNITITFPDGAPSSVTVNIIGAQSI